MTATLSPAEVRLLVKGDTAVFADTPIYAAMLADPPNAEGAKRETQTWPVSSATSSGTTGETSAQDHSLAMPGNSADAARKAESFPDRIVRHGTPEVVRDKAGRFTKTRKAKRK